jgi:hypothetical protein
VQAAQPGAQLLAHARVERTERLVEEQDPRLHGERPRERHPLALAARELGGVALGEAVELDQLEQLVDPPRDLRLRDLPDPEPEGDVLAHAQVLERGVVLEDEADAPLLRRQRGHGLAEDQHLAGVGLLEPRDHA